MPNLKLIPEQKSYLGDRVNNLETQIQQLANEFSNFQEDMNVKIKNLESNANKTKLNLQQSQEVNQQLFDYKMKEVYHLDEFSNQTFTNLMAMRKEDESKLNKNIDIKMEDIKHELQMENKNRIEAFNELNSCLETDLPKLNEKITTETMEREVMTQKINEKFQEEMSLIEQNLEREIKLKDEGQEAIHNMVSDIVSRVKNELEEEKNNRESTEEMLLNLLEETCNKMNAEQQE